MKDYISYLNGVIPDKDCLKIVKSEAEKFRSSHSSNECHTMGMTLYQSDNFQIQEIGIFTTGVDEPSVFQGSSVRRYPSAVRQENG